MSRRSCGERQQLVHVEDDEEAAALAAGWQAVSLGPLILRSGTAAVTAAAQLASWRALLSAPAV
jgi:hypothetical protein